MTSHSVKTFPRAVKLTFKKWLLYLVYYLDWTLQRYIIAIRYNNFVSLDAVVILSMLYIKKRAVIPFSNKLYVSCSN